MDLTVEEVLERIEEDVRRIQATRVVINSISGFELAIAPTERDDFREALYRLTRGLSGRRITVLMTTEVLELFGGLQFTFHNVSFLTDNVILLRYVEIESRLSLALTVVKMRSSQHSRELREYAITERGLAVGGVFEDYTAVLSGIPTPSSVFELPGRGLSSEERSVLQALIERGESTAAQVASRLRMEEQLAARLLESLSRRRYVAEVVEPGRVSYHAVLPPPRGRRGVVDRGGDVGVD